MKKLLLVALAVVGLASCVQNEELVVPQNTAAISFDSFVGNATKADPSYNETTKPLEAFKVWAFMDETAGNVFDEEVVTNNGGVWSYQNLQYWYPKHTYYFAALAPVEDAHWSVVEATDDAKAVYGLGTVSFTNVDGTEDLLYAKAKETTPADAATLANQGMKAVEMDFQHLLSKVKFTFQNGFNANNTTVQVTNVTMTAPKSGTIDLAQADYATKWVLGTENITLAFGNVANPLALAASAEAADERLTIPAAATQEYTVNFHVVVKQGSVEAMASDLTATISGVALEMGKAYNFTAVINQDVLDLKPIEFTASVSDWTPAGDFSAYIYEADGFGKDSTTGFYHIENRAGLQYFAAQVNGGRTFVGEKVVLDGDIDLSATRAASNWTPIGNVVTSTYDSKKFAGTFDGQGHSILNMVVADQKAAAFFGSMYTGTIKNLTIENATVSSNHYAAGIVAWTERGGKALVIENCHVKNSTIVSAPELVNGAYDNGDKVGGIVGHAYGIDALKNCSVENTAITAYRDLGGIAGYATKSKITNCLVKNVTVSQDLANGYKAEVPTTIGAVVGRYGENNVIENNTEENVAVATVVDTKAELEAALADAGLSVVTLGTCEFGTIVMKSNKTIVGTPGAKVDCVNLYGAKNATIKNIVFDAATAVMNIDGKGVKRQMANIITGSEDMNNKNLGAHNVTIDGCTFIGTFANGGAAISFADRNRTSGQSKNITIKNCTFNTVNGYYDIYGYYFGGEQMNIENNVFLSTRSQGKNIYLGQYQSSVPVVVKGNQFTVSTIEEALYYTAHSGYTVTIDASDNTFGIQ